MHLHCRLRELREAMPRKDDGQPVSLRDIEAVSGVSAGVLSQIERGVSLPTDQQLAGIEEAYGAPPEQWYEPRALLVIQSDREAA